MIQPVEHQCLPRTSQPCPRCGELLAAPVYCTTCGEDLTPQHTCASRPLPHVCPPREAPGRCLACGEVLPRKQFCPTCGADITPPHHCAAGGPLNVPRAAPVHICPALKLPRCETCGELLPALAYCPDCGADITPEHVCRAEPAAHVCPPHLTMPRRCSSCGDVLPAPQHCAHCGADITPRHVCEQPA
jgi:hypothetical protein